MEKCAASIIAFPMRTSPVETPEHAARSWPSWIAGATVTALLFALASGMWTWIPFWRQTITGDIPHYLVAVQSLLEDGDFDLADNYADDARRAAYYPAPLGPQTAPGTTRPYRGAGIPLLLTPGWLMAGPPGALGVAALALCVASGLLAGLAFHQTRRLSIALVTGAVALFNLPTLGYLHFPYPDVFSGVIHLALFAVLTRAIPASRRPIAGIIAAALLSAVLPWLHQKFTALLPFHWALIILWSPRERRATAAIISGVILLLGVVAYLVHLELLGIDPRSYGGDARLAPWPQIAFGLLFDRQFGLFYQFPLLALAVAELARQILFGPRRAAFTALALIASAWGLHTWYWYWFGGLSPAGRHTLNFLFVLLAFLAPFAQRCFERPRIIPITVALILLALHVAQITAVLWQGLLHMTLNIHPYLFIGVPEPDWLQYPYWGRAKLFDHFGIGDHLPSLIFIEGKGLRTLMATLTLLLLFTLCHCWPQVRQARRPLRPALIAGALVWIGILSVVYWDMRTHRVREPRDFFVELWGRPPSAFDRP